MDFSVVIPAYDAAAWLDAAVDSVLAQGDGVEIVIVDDCSSDSSFEIAQRRAAETSRVKALQTPRNLGPGAARNVGLDAARGDWIIFLDSDDALRPDAIAQIRRKIETSGADTDLVSYDWRDEAGGGGRKDLASVQKPRWDLIRDALALKTDGSVIFTAMRRSMLDKAELRFADGLHEDVDFIFKAYWLARSIAIIDAPLYEKRSRDGSIVNTITPRHVDGFTRAFADIGAFAKAEAPDMWPQLEAAYRQGWVAVVATRLRALVQLNPDIEHASSVLARLVAAAKNADISLDGLSEPVRRTTYAQIAERFLTLADAKTTMSQKAAELFEFVETASAKSWSCTDLHHSAFLRSDQVRTCCKRFFVDGEMRGDVVLLEADGEDASFTPDDILAAKQDLYGAINKGEASACDGCPFLEFKDWGGLAELDVRYLSMEHHSVCNLKCTYCSDEYYGGETAGYDVGALVTEMAEAGAMDQCHTVVWGGGEPTVDKAFDPLVRLLAARVPQVKQRVLTNSVALSRTVDDMLADDKVVVTTSVDAGTEDVFASVRGKPRLHRVMKNLRAYADTRAQNVTVKYIFTEGNSTVDEALSFAGLVQEYGLLDCNFQISGDFKREDVAQEALAAMVALYGKLNAMNCRLVFFDDLLRQRLNELPEAARRVLAAQLSELGLEKALADKTAFPKVAVWGAGWQAKFLLERSAFFKSVDVDFFVDATPSKIGTQFLDRDIRSPDALFDSDVPVVIAAAQGYPAIYQSFLDLGVDPKRLVRSAII